MAAVLLSEYSGLKTTFMFSINFLFKSLEKHLEKDLNLKTQYFSDITGDEEKGYEVPVRLHDPKTVRNGNETFRTSRLQPEQTRQNLAHFEFWTELPNFTANH